MRVIAGHHRSRVLVAPPGRNTRPTSDRLRETLFNVLAQRVSGCCFADLYAGSGAVGIEALSRGATLSFFAESAPSAVKAIRANLTALNLLGQATLEAKSVARALTEAEREGLRFDVVFLDPPYESADEYTMTLTRLGNLSKLLLRDNAMVVAEHARRAALPAVFGDLQRTRLLEQGDASLSFYAIQRRYPPPL